MAIWGYLNTDKNFIDYTPEDQANTLTTSSAAINYLNFHGINFDSSKFTNGIFLAESTTYNPAAPIQHDSFISLTDTPSNYPGPDIFKPKFLRNNVAGSGLIFDVPKFENLADVSIEDRETGDILIVDSAGNIQAEIPRDKASFMGYTKGGIGGELKSVPFNLLYVEDNNTVITPAPGSANDGDILYLINNNSLFNRTITIEGNSIVDVNGAKTYILNFQKESVLRYKESTKDWEVLYEIDIRNSLTFASDTGTYEGIKKVKFEGDITADEDEDNPGQLLVNVNAAPLQIDDGKLDVAGVRRITLHGAYITGTADDLVLTVHGSGGGIDGGNAGSTFEKVIDGGNANG